MIGLTLITLLLLCNNRVLSNLLDFNFYWNVPTFMCHQYGLDFDEVARNYGIIQNVGDSFRGDKIAILYDPGMFPALIENSDGTLQKRNGGVPQEGNLTEHLNLFERHLNDQITPDFSGVGIIDFEKWRPIFRQHWVSLEKYKHLSINIERKNYPLSNEKILKRIATKRFEKFAQIFMEETLKLAKKLRPNAKWGFYAYPYCFKVSSNGPSFAQCPDQVRSENDRMSWLWEIEDILMPSVYLNSKLSRKDKSNRIVGRTNEATRLAKRYNPNAKIILYFWFKYQDKRQKYLNKDDVYNGFKIMVSNGADGTIIWGSSQDVNSRKKCEDFQNYLHNTLGPAIITIKLYVQQRNSKHNDQIMNNGTTSPWLDETIPFSISTI